MKKLFIIGYCLLIVGCNSQHKTDNTQSIHPSIAGTIKQHGQPVVNAQISLTSTNCDEVISITDSKGQFSLEQYCPVATASLAVMGSVVDMSYPFDITITTHQKSYRWSVINPYDIKVAFDLTELVGCQTTIQDSHCSELVSLDSIAKTKQQHP